MSLSRLQVPQIDYKPTHRLAPNFPGHPTVDGSNPARKPVGVDSLSNIPGDFWTINSIIKDFFGGIMNDLDLLVWCLE